MTKLYIKLLDTWNLRTYGKLTDFWSLFYEISFYKKVRQHALYTLALGHAHSLSTQKQ